MEIQNRGAASQKNFFFDSVKSMQIPTKKLSDVLLNVLRRANEQADCLKKRRQISLCEWKVKFFEFS